MVRHARHALCLLSLVGLSAEAAAGCWGSRSEAGAKVRALQSMLMVGTLRCRAFGLDITQPYNLFVVANRTTLQEANAMIKAHLAAEAPALAERRYDSFTTALANRYGDADTSREVCGTLAGLALEASEAGGFEALAAMAERAEVDPLLPGGRCSAGLSAVVLEGEGEPEGEYPGR